jgi:putative ABC transport system permease protein
MLPFSFMLRRLRRHWRLNLAVLMGLALAAGLLAGLPSYAAAIAARSLGRHLETAPPSVRNLYVTGQPSVLTAGLYGKLRDDLGDLMSGGTKVRQGTLAPDPVPPTAEVDGTGKVIDTLRVWSFDGFSGDAHLVDGEMPTVADPREAPDLYHPPPVEVVLGARAAERTGRRVGDRLTVGEGDLKLDIVGIVEPNDPHADVWGGDLAAFDIEVNSANPNVDAITLNLIIAPGSMVNFFEHVVAWRVFLDRALITADNAGAVQARLISVQTMMGTHRAQISTGLIQILESYVSQLSRVRISLFLLTAQAFVFVLYALSMFSSFLLDRSQAELATLAGRGATAAQITLIFALEGLILALPAMLLLGPGLALAALRVWASLTGAPPPAILPIESWLLAGVAGAFGWLALVLPVYPAARRNLLEWERTRARPERLSGLQKRYLDVFLLVFGGLLYWQLGQSGSFISSRLGDTFLADPLLLLGPSLLLVAIALAFLRAFPYLLRLVAWGLRRTRGLLLPLGLSRLARDPLKSSRVVLLISLTAALTLFASSLAASLDHGQEEMAHYLAGADLRVAVDSPEQFQQLAQSPEVQAASYVFQGSAQLLDGRGVPLFALDPESFDRVATYPSGLTRLKISTLTHILQGAPDPGTIRAIFSYAALPPQTEPGDTLPIKLGGQQVDVTVQGIVSNFPTLSGRFLIVSLPQLEQGVDLSSFGVHAFGKSEAWLSIDPLQRAQLLQRPELQGRIIGDAGQQLTTLQSDALAQGTNGAFQLSAAVLALLSVTAFLLVHYFAAQQRTVEFGVLRAMGLSARQLLTLLATEGILVLVLGLASGSAIGYALAHTMVPYLSRALSAALAGVTIGRVLVDWGTLTRLYATLLGFYALAILLLLTILMRVGIHRAMRIGDE